MIKLLILIQIVIIQSNSSIINGNKKKIRKLNLVDNLTKILNEKKEKWKILDSEMKKNIDIKKENTDDQTLIIIQLNDLENSINNLSWTKKLMEKNIKKNI